MTTASADQDPRWAQVALRAECARCGGSVPVEGPWPEEACRDCGANVEVPFGAIVALLDRFEDAWPRVPRRKPWGERLDVGAVGWRLTIQGGTPCCDAPDYPLEGDGPSRQRCGNCSHQARTVRIPVTVRRRLRSAAYAVGVDEPPASRAAAEPPRPIPIRCTGCAAGLLVEPRHGRMAACEHCGTTSTVPDEIWKALHPPRAMRGWWVQLVGPSRAVIRAQEEEALRRRDLQWQKQREAERAAKRAAEAEKAAERQRRLEVERAKQQRERAEQRRLERYALLIGLPVGLGGAAVLAGAIAWLSLRLAGLGAGLGAFGLVIDVAVLGAAVVVGGGALAATLKAVELREGKPPVDDAFSAGMMTAAASFPLVGMFTIFWPLMVLFQERPSNGRTLLRAAPAVVLLVPLWGVFTSSIVWYVLDASWSEVLTAMFTD